MNRLEILVRDEYAKAPALAAFSRRPVPFETAAKYGRRAVAEAYQRARGAIDAEPDLFGGAA